MGYPMGWSQEEFIIFLKACLAFWMLPRSGFLFLRKTNSCCCPAQRPRTHSLFTCSTRGQHLLQLFVLAIAKSDLQFSPWWHESWDSVCWAWWFCTRWFLRRGRGAGRGAMGRWTARRSSRQGRLRERSQDSAGGWRWLRTEPRARRTHPGT